MSVLKLTSRVLKQEYKKRTIHSKNQFYDVNVHMINNSMSISMTGSTPINLSLVVDKEVLLCIIKDLEECAALLTEDKS